ncbi:X-linked retinitis pigmentosa GTPase regulator-like protein [Dinothrombium tinctorium]|uniref:X-linked retinitis pigmentosa GTPase regulator-like protein n=1 Tax=Dinothrombium tinctorium TaxID=1965070 RepID=A0A3S3SHD8_9ACAR|nr:X-linked retinitis pigmentosa GTPase regulator-like protein [Dinothrombium tinctorium]
MFDLFEARKRVHFSLPHNSSDGQLSPQHPSICTVDKCVFHENGSHLILVLVSSVAKTLVFCFADKNHGEQNSSNGFAHTTIRNVPLHPSKQVNDLCFNATGTWLLLVLEDRTLLKLAVDNILHAKQPFDKDAVFITTCPILSPVCVVWWTTLDGQQDIAIIGNSFGEITFVNILSTKEIGGTYVPFSVRNFSVIRDKYNVSLLISCKNESQWKLTLEETRRKASRRRGSVTSAEDVEEGNKNYFGCFITNYEESESPLVECWNLKPKLVNTKKSRDSSTEESALLYQFPFLLHLTNSPSDKYLWLKVYSCQEFDYEFSSPMSSFIIPKNYIDFVMKIIVITERIILTVKGNFCYLLSKEFCDSKKQKEAKCCIQEFDFGEEQILCCFKSMKVDDDNLLDHFLLITSQGVYELLPKTKCETQFINLLSSPSEAGISKAEKFASMLRLNVNVLYEKAADICLKKRQFPQAVRFYQLSKTPQLKRIANFIAYGYFAEVIAYVQVLFSSRSHEVVDVDKLHFANIAVNCLIQEILEKRKEECQNIINALRNFIIENPYYDDQVVIRLLLQYGFFELASLCAETRGQHCSYLYHLINLQSLQSKCVDSGLYEITLSSPYKDVIEEKYKCYSYLRSLTSDNLIQAIIVKPFLLAKTLKTLINVLPYLDLQLLISVASNFDFRMAKVQILLRRVLPNLRQEYLDDNKSDDIVKKSDVLNFYIFVLLMIIRQKELNKKFDRRLINFKSDKDEKKLQSRQPKTEFAVEAGYAHSAAILKGTLYMWGRRKFGNIPYSPDLNISEFENVATPTPITVFSKTMSVSVCKVACGALHTLVLTDCGCFSFGSSKYGQLGVGKELQQTSVPILIEKLVNESISEIYCGQYHSLAISSTGFLFTWGWGIHGQLGHSNVENLYFPRVVESLKGKRIVAACGGYCHSLSLDSNGVVYSFGNGLFGQLGNGLNTKCSTPHPITLIKSHIKMISSKYFHSLALASDSKTIYVWGCNPHIIRLQMQASRKTRGKQPSEKLEKTEKSSINSSAHLIPQVVDTKNIMSDIVKISAGNTHCLLLTSEGNIYSWGRGLDGQLGHGASKELKQPTLIIGDRFRDVCASCDFSLAVDMNGSFWGWGLNSFSQLGMESLAVADSANSSLDKKSRKVTIKTNRRLLTFVSGEKSVETQPTKIKFPPNIEFSLDSISIDSRTLVTVVDRHSLAENHLLTTEQSLVFDQTVFASFLINHKQDLDLRTLTNHCLNLENYQSAAFIYETIDQLDLSLEYHLLCLLSFSRNNSEELNDMVELIFAYHISKSILRVNECKKVIKKLYEIWMKNDKKIEELEMIVLHSYERKIENFIFGVVFFHFVQEFDNEIYFSKPFKLNMVSITLQLVKKAEISAFTSQPVMQLMTSDRQYLNFATEKQWQNIVRNFSDSMLSVEDQSGVEFEACSDEMLVFSCNHYFDARTVHSPIESISETKSSEKGVHLCPKCTPFTEG